MGNGLPFKGSQELSGCSEAAGTNIPSAQGRPGNEADVSDSETGTWKTGLALPDAQYLPPSSPRQVMPGELAHQQPKDLVSLLGFP